MTISRRGFLGVLTASACAGCASSSSSASHGGRTIRLDRADALARQHGCRGWAAWRRGSRVEGWEISYEGPILSITKALAALAVTRGVAEGWLDPGERAADTIPEWKGDARKQRITLQMLLQQTAGLEAGVAALYRNPTDKGRNAVALRAIDEPGSFFRYGPACSEVLAELLQRKLSARGETLEKYLHRAVMRPIGLGSPDWRSDKKGRFYLSTGAELSVDELGKLGRTIARLLSGDGADGFDAGHFARVTRASAANPMYGGGLWRNAGGREIEVEDALDPAASTGFWQGAGLSRSQPREFYALIGSSGRRVFIWPQEQVVIARHGVARSWRDGAFLRAL
ncbi:beta-lactamase family protein [Luteolibacter flavescens]|uniref:Beta-lactamase family protein n=1 Tax=Luteolibacter flavescens TaxID=1859460 RepID=A0ABT3FMW1_9BACT|nr:serine hydrolase domain-containing protein [Luteolibacter flavescens]MCW1884911.1 beta-lactamase family protein [Luteolibacter flavescens]